MDNSLNDAQPEDVPAPRKLSETDEELIALVTQGLTRYRNRDKIIAEVCKRTGWHWKEAQEYLREVEEEHTPAIAGKQARIILPLGVGIMLAGVAQVIIALWLMYSLSLDLLAQPGLVLGDEAEIPFILDTIIVIAQVAPHLFVLLMSGIAFCFGGALGLVRIVDRMRGLE